MAERSTNSLVERIGIYWNRWFGPSAFSLAKEATGLYRSGDFSEAMDKAKFAMKVYPDKNVFKDLYFLSLLSFDPKGEETRISELLQDQQYQTRTKHLTLATVRPRSEFEDAKESLKISQEKLPNHPNTIYRWNLRLISPEMQMYSGARTGALALHNNSYYRSEFLELLGDIANRMGRNRRAISLYRGMVETAREDGRENFFFTTKLELADLLTSIEFGGKLSSHDEAKKYLENPPKWAQQHHYYWAVNGHIQLRLGTPESNQSAETHFLRATELNPGHPPSYRGLGNSQRQLKKYDESLQSLEKAIELEPADGSGFYEKGLTLQKLMRHNEAFRNLHRAIQLKPSLSHAYEGAGESYMAMANREIEPEKRERMQERARGLINHGRTLQGKPLESAVRAALDYLGEAMEDLKK